MKISIRAGESWQCMRKYYRFGERTSIDYLSRKVNFSTIDSLIQENNGNATDTNGNSGHKEAYSNNEPSEPEHFRKLFIGGLTPNTTEEVCHSLHVR